MEKFLPEIKLSYTKGSFIDREKSITCSTDSYSVIKNLFDADTIELFESVIILYLDNSLKPIGFIRHSTGSTNSSCIDKKLIISSALLSNASAFIIAHNHPSGNLIPSYQDKTVMEDLKKAATFFDIRLIDSLILSNERYYSMMDNMDI